MLDAETHLLVTPEAAEAFQYQTSMLFDPLEDPLTKTALPIAALSVMHRIACRGSKWRVIGLVTVLDVLATLTSGTNLVIAGLLMSKSGLQAARTWTDSV